MQQIELLLSHLQHDVDKLNEALTEQHLRLESLVREFEQHRSTFEETAPPRDPEAERPPHY